MGPNVEGDEGAKDEGGRVELEEKREAKTSALREGSDTCSPEGV